MVPHPLAPPSSYSTSSYSTSSRNIDAAEGGITSGKTPFLDSCVLLPIPFYSAIPGLRVCNEGPGCRITS